MKFFMVVDKDKEPSVTVVCHKVTRVVAQIEELCKSENADGDLLYGYTDEEIVPLELTEVACFFTRDNKIYARMGGKEYATYKIIVKGDLDGDGRLNITDAVMARHAIAKLYTLDDLALIAADVAENNGFNITDTILIRHNVAKK